MANPLVERADEIYCVLGYRLSIVHLASGSSPISWARIRRPGSYQGPIGRRQDRPLVERNHDRGGPMNTRKLLGFATAVSAQALFLLAGPSTAHAAPAAPSQLKAAIAPPLHAGKVTATSDLGLWDDVFVAH